MNDLLVAISDSRRLDQAKQLFSGAYDPGGWDGDCMLLAHGVEEEQLQWFLDRGIMARNAALPCQPDAWYAMQGQPINPPTLSLVYRIFSADFARWRKVLYLDSDMIVRAPLGRIAHARVFAAAPDFTFTIADQFIASPAARRILSSKFDIGRPAFNAGLMCFRPGSLERDAYSRILELHDEYFSLGKTTVQSILNLYFYDRWDRLPRYYNFPYSEHLALFRGRVIRVFDDGGFLNGCILHFWGKSKPWLPGHPFRQEWLQSFNRADQVRFPARDRRPVSRPVSPGAAAAVFRVCVALLMVVQRARQLRRLFRPR